MRRLAASTLAVLAIPLAGCGAAASSSGDFEGEQKSVAQAIEDIQAAAERQNTAKLCDELFAKPYADEVRAGATSCVEETQKAIDDADEFNLDVKSVTVNGDQATAKVDNKNGTKTGSRTFEMVKEGSQWKLVSLRAG
jgi:hypothetical protein